MQDKQQQLGGLQRRLKHPGARLQDVSQRLDELELRLLRSHQRLLDLHQSRLQQLGQRVLVSSPQSHVERQFDRLRELQQQLLKQWRQKLHDRQQALAQSSDLLHSVSPLQTLQRGYAIVANAEGAIVKSVGDLKQDDRINIRMSDGDVDASVL